ncbi:UNVERIFIED_CONTAM: hypothetical protein FKN15_048710 [Acipenser sinensis]
MPLIPGAKDPATEDRIEKRSLTEGDDAAHRGGCMVSLQCEKKWSAGGTRFRGQSVFIFAAPEVLGQAPHQQSLDQGRNGGVHWGKPARASLSVPSKEASGPLASAHWALRPDDPRRSVTPL